MHQHVYGLRFYDSIHSFILLLLGGPLINDLIGNDDMRYLINSSR